jgi:8-oxo-dGTP pyrophosphatase MutT (NUDIX family)
MPSPPVPDGRTRETARPRPAARVVLLDADDRILLVRSEWDDRTLWFTPGGGLEPGEEPEAGARRELREETGLDATTLRWDGECWVRDWTWHYVQQDRWVASHEHFFLARYPGAGPALPNGDHDHTDEEILVLQEFRWWSLVELRAERPDTSPACLLDVLPALIEGGCPAEPVAIGR